MEYDPGVTERTPPTEDGITRDALERLLAAEDELHAARAAYQQHMAQVAAGLVAHAPPRERIRAAAEARAIAMQQARAVLAEGYTGVHPLAEGYTGVHPDPLSTR